MSIRRPRGPKPSLKHLAFLEAMIEQPEQSAHSRGLRASFLTLRLFDEWALRGAAVMEDSTPMRGATSAAVDALQDDRDLQALLTRIVDGMLTLRDLPPSGVLPRVAALAELYAQRGEHALAADIRLLAGAAAPSLATRESAAAEVVA
jgi:hypothetical protein